MNISFNIFLIFIINMISLILFPETGKMGFPFLFISLLIFSAFTVMTKAAFSRMRQDTIIFFNILFIMVLLISNTTLMPQIDGVSPLTKMIRGGYPNRMSLYKGLCRIGLKYDSLLIEAIKEKGKETQK